MVDKWERKCNQMDFTYGNDWASLSPMSHDDLLDISCKISEYSKTHSYKTSTLQHEYPAKCLDIGSAIAISMPGDEDWCAHYALSMLANYVDDSLDMTPQEQFIWQWNIIMNSMPWTMSLFELDQRVQHLFGRYSPVYRDELSLSEHMRK